MADYENKVVSHISVYLDKTEKNLPAYVYAKQYDSNSRYIVVRVLTEDGVYVPPEVCQLNATKPDGNMAYVEGEVNADNTVSFLLTSNLLAYHGTVSCDISFFSSGEKQALLTTSTFYIVVGRSNFDADAVESTTEEMIAIIAEAKAAGDAAQEVADEVQRKLDAGEFIGPPGQKGDPGESLKGAGEWDSTKSYSERSMVSYNGSSYMAITDVPPGVLIPDDYYWMLVAQKGNGEVSSVNGKSGDVVLSKADIGLGEVENGAQENKIESISAGGTLLSIVNKNVDLPVAGTILGLVKSSGAENGISIFSDGTMGVNDINVNKLVQTDGDLLDLQCGTSVS